MNNNIIYLTDSYKPTHWKQYPQGTTKIGSYLESRQTDRPTMFFGLQYIIKEYLEGQVFDLEDVEEAKEFYSDHFGKSNCFNYEGWKRMYEKYEGRLPVKIRAVPEGTVVPGRNVLMTVENTDPEFYWLTNYIESLLVQIWYPITVATNSMEIKNKLLEYLAISSDKDAEGRLGIANFMCHDFGFRGVSSVETAGLGGASHLLSFMGTDNLKGIRTLQEYYDAGMVGFSIPASEHSTITAWGEAGEPDAFENMLDQYPEGMVACVSDSYDILRAVREYWGEDLREKILNREGRLVIRPDSGDPVTTTEKLMDILCEKFPYTVNSKGLKVLDEHIRIIQGDGIDQGMIIKILDNFMEKGYAPENIAFGSGGGLLQRFNRDTLRFAFKCSYAVVNGEERDVRKFPKSLDENSNYSKSFKTSKAGKLYLVEDFQSGEYRTITGSPEGKKEITRTVFENGELLIEEDYDQIKNRAYHEADKVW